MLLLDLARRAIDLGARPEYHQAFREWIVRQGAVAFDVREVTDRSPPPGAREPRDTAVRALFASR